MILIHQRYRQTDGRTDGQTERRTTLNLITALRISASRGKKLSYRRETAHQLRTSCSARLLIVHFTEHRICCTTRPIYNKLPKLVSTQSTITNRATYVIGEAFKHYYTFKVICFCVIRKPIRAFKTRPSMRGVKTRFRFALSLFTLRFCQKRALFRSAHLRVLPRDAV